MHNSFVGFLPVNSFHKVLIRNVGLITQTLIFSFLKYLKFNSYSIKQTFECPFTRCKKTLTDFYFHINVKVEAELLPFQFTYKKSQ